MIDVSNAFDDFLETVTLIRETPGAYDSNGDWQDGVPNKSDILGVVQSLNANELLVLAEGDRTKSTAKIHTQTELRTADELTSTKADKIEYQGSTWNVSSVNNRKTIGGYFKAILVRL